MPGKALTIKKASRKKYYPTSRVQKKFWRIAKRPDPTFFNIGSVLKLSGFLNIKIFRKALREIVKRHEILRTNFLEINGELFQVIKKKVQPTIKVINLYKDKKFTGAAGQNLLKTLIRNEIYKPFNLEKDLPLRTTLIKTGRRDSLLILVVHGMVWDGPSYQLLLDEWAELYNSYLEKKPSHLPPLPIQFKDYAEWEQSDKYNKRRETQKNYWLKKLKGDLPLPLCLPGARTSVGLQLSPVDNAVDNTKELIIDNKEILGKIKTICRQTKATTFMFVLALLDIFLFKVTGEKDLIVETSVSLRNSSELIKSMGPILNTLALRNQLLPQQNFIDVLKVAKKTVLEAIANREYSFSEFWEENKKVPKNPDRPLLNIFLEEFPYRRDDQMRKLFKGIEFSFTRNRLNRFRKISFDLVLAIKKSSDALLLLAFIYNHNLFSQKKMKEFLQNFEVILKQIVRNPFAKISDLKIEK